MRLVGLSACSCVVLCSRWERTLCPPCWRRCSSTTRGTSRLPGSPRSSAPWQPSSTSWASTSREKSPRSLMPSLSALWTWSTRSVCVINHTCCQRKRHSCEVTEFNSSLFSPSGLWRIPRTQNPFLLPPSSRHLPVLPSLPVHRPGPVQTDPGLHHLGLQAHDEERGWHRSEVATTHLVR